MINGLSSLYNSKLDVNDPSIWSIVVFNFVNFIKSLEAFSTLSTIILGNSLIAIICSICSLNSGVKYSSYLDNLKMCMLDCC